MILSAKETKYMADSYYNCKINYIMKCIKNASYSGNYDVQITEEIDRTSVEKLMQLGYTVEAHTPALYTIGWGK